MFWLLTKESWNVDNVCAFFIRMILMSLKNVLPWISKALVGSWFCIQLSDIWLCISALYLWTVWSCLSYFQEVDNDVNTWMFYWHDCCKLPNSFLKHVLLFFNYSCSRFPPISFPFPTHPSLPHSLLPPLSLSMGPLFMFLDLVLPLL